MKWRAIPWKRVFLIAAIVFVAMQVIRPSRANPPIDPSKQLVAPADVQAIFARSCNDCHSSRTVWPWYTAVAPVSWWLADHVHEGRREVNFSEWQSYSAKRKARKLKEICEQVEQGEMPLKAYLPLHPEAKLSDAERVRICEWAKSAPR